jgi:hypothetical protein
MHTYSFEVPISFSKVHTVFSNKDVLDSVHGRGLWRFSNWEEDEDGSYTRNGIVDGVEVPTFVRFLNKGKKYIRCIVRQRYVPGHDFIRLESTTVPNILGDSFVKNTSSIDIYRKDVGCYVRGQYMNSTTLPHPIGSMAIEVMNEMSQETVGFLEDALR